MARQFYDGYPKIYDRRKDIFSGIGAEEGGICCKDDDKINTCQCREEKCEKKECCKEKGSHCEKKECCREKDAHCGKKECCKENDVCCEEKSACGSDLPCDIPKIDSCCNTGNPCAPSPCSGKFFDGLFDNMALDDIILLGIVLILLHDGTNDTLLLIIIGIIFLEGLT